MKLGQVVTLKGHDVPMVVTNVDELIEVTWLDVGLHAQHTAVRPEALKAWKEHFYRDLLGRTMAAKKVGSKVRYIEHVTVSPGMVEAIILRPNSVQYQINHGKLAIIVGEGGVELVLQPHEAQAQKNHS